MDSVDWDRVNSALERDGHRMVWKPYGLPDIMDLERSAFFEGEISPQWDTPSTMAVSVAITGAFFRHDQNPHQPLTPSQIRDEARQCAAAGASTVHIHVRDENGYNTLSADLFAEVIEPLRDEFPNLAVDGCLVAALPGEWQEMRRVLDAGLLDAVPINTTATYVGDALFAKPPAYVMEKTRLVLEAGAKPIIACYTDADVGNAERWLFTSGLLDEGAYWLLLPALPGCSPMRDPMEMVESLTRTVRAVRKVDPSAFIGVCAAGRPSLHLITVAAALGLHIRVGMEDTVWLWPHRDDRVTSNVQLLEKALALAEVVGRDVADHRGYRELAGIPQRIVADRS